ncbi:MAG: hypothetical protein SOY42_09965 [Clostridium sp.]|nr:hypothetical protein [Clostridium sp.]
MYILLQVKLRIAKFITTILENLNRSMEKDAEQIWLLRFRREQVKKLMDNSVTNEQISKETGLYLKNVKLIRKEWEAEQRNR